MLCIPEHEQLFNSAHIDESKGLFMWPGLLTISQQTVAVFYLDSPIPCIKIQIKDNTVIVSTWSSLLCLCVHDSHYADRVPNVSRTFELFDGVFPE